MWVPERQEEEEDLLLEAQASHGRCLKAGTLQSLGI